MVISIITVVHNSETTIGDTLRSVERQNYGFIEHIIVDGASTDKTLEIVQSFSHVSKIISEPDAGIYDALNKGIRVATGDIIGLLHSDDFYPNQTIISEVVKEFQTKNIQSLYGDLEYVHPIQTGKLVRYWKSGKFQRDRFLRGWSPPHPTFFVRREIYEKFGLFNLRLKIAGDYELMLRLLFKQKISTHYLPKVLVKMRTGGTSNANLNNRMKANEEDQMSWELNGLKPKFYTVFLKPIRKIPQYFLMPNNESKLIFSLGNIFSNILIPYFRQKIFKLIRMQ